MINKKALILTGVMLLAIGSAIPASASAGRMDTDKKIESVKEMTGEDYMAIPDVTKRLNEMDFLTKEEKDILIKEQKKAAPIYKEIQRLTKKADNLIKKALMSEDIEALKSEQDKIYDRNMKIWMKLDSEVFDGKEMMNSEKKLEMSKSLTDKEKSMIMEDAKKWDELDMKIVDIQAKADKAAEKENKKIKAAYAKLDKLYKKTAALHRKISAVMDGK